MFPTNSTRTSRVLFTMTGALATLVAAFAFAVTYDAIRFLVQASGPWLGTIGSQLYPLLATTVRLAHTGLASRAWPIAVLLVFGALTVWGDIARALQTGGGWQRIALGVAPAAAVVVLVEVGVAAIRRRIRLPHLGQSSAMPVTNDPKDPAC